MTFKQLTQANKMLDETCQDLECDNLELLQEVKTLKGIISLMMSTSEQTSKIMKLQTPQPMHIKIENDYCIITMGEIPNGEPNKEGIEKPVEVLEI